MTNTETAAGDGPPIPSGLISVAGFNDDQLDYREDVQARCPAGHTSPPHPDGLNRADCSADLAGLIAWAAGHLDCTPNPASRPLHADAEDLANRQLTGQPVLLDWLRSLDLDPDRIVALDLVTGPDSPPAGTLHATLMLQISGHAYLTSDGDLATTTRVVPLTQPIPPPILAAFRTPKSI